MAGFLEFVLDLGEGKFSLLDLSKSQSVGFTVEGGEETEAFVDSSDSTLEFDDLVFIFFMSLFSGGGDFSDVVVGVFDGLFKVGDLFFVFSLHNVEDVIKESFGSGDIGVGGIDVVLKSLDFVVVVNGSGVEVFISGFELNVQVVDNFL